MSTEYKSFHVREPEFGASTGFYAKIEDGKVAKIIDVSTHNTNYAWDLNNPPYEMVGKDATELSQKMKHYFDDYDDEFRTPFIYEDNISEQEFRRVEIIEKMQEQRDKIASKRQQKRNAQGTDKLAEKESKLDSASNRVLKKRYFQVRKGTVDEETMRKEMATARIMVAKEYMKKSR